MGKRRRVGKCFYKEETVDVEFHIDDVIEYIEDYATDDECKTIAETLASVTNEVTSFALFESNGMEGTLVQDMKSELLALAFKKFSLEELEQRLGTKFDLT